MVRIVEFLCLDLLLVLLALFGLAVNVYVLVAVLASKEPRSPSILFLLNLSFLDVLASAVFLCAAAPTLLFHSSDDDNDGVEQQHQNSSSSNSTFQLTQILCQSQSFVLTLSHPAIAWTVAGVHLDRFVSIANPLRYSSVLSLRKTALLLALSWVISLSLSAPATAVARISPRPGVGACLPDFQDRNSYLAVLATSAYFSLGFVLPVVFVLAVNLKIARIAKYHQFRIANALFGMMVPAGANNPMLPFEAGGAAKVQRKQSHDLKDFQGRRGVVTILESVGSLLCMYLPLSAVLVVESAVGGAVDQRIFKLALLAITASPLVYGIVFGFKHKVIYLGLLHFFRKEMYKSEVQQEIRLRSPAGGGGQNGGVNGGGFGGSNRPSMGSIVGHITLHMPTYLTRQLSYTSLAPEAMYLNRPPHRCKSAGSMRRATLCRTGDNGNNLANSILNSANNAGGGGGGRKRNATGEHSDDSSKSPSRSNSDKWADRRARLRRHVSDLTWRLNSINAARNLVAREESQRNNKCLRSSRLDPSSSRRQSIASNASLEVPSARFGQQKRRGSSNRKGSGTDEEEEGGIQFMTRPKLRHPRRLDMHKQGSASSDTSCPEDDGRNMGNGGAASKMKFFSKKRASQRQQQQQNRARATVTSEISDSIEFDAAAAVGAAGSGGNDDNSGGDSDGAFYNSRPGSAASSRQASICSAGPVPFATPSPPAGPTRPSSRRASACLTPTKKQIGQAIRAIWHQNRNCSDRPRITISRAPTVDQSSMDCLCSREEAPTQDRCTERSGACAESSSSGAVAAVGSRRKKNYVFVNLDGDDRKKSSEKKEEEENKSEENVNYHKKRRTSDVRITISLPPPPPAEICADNDCVRLGRLLWRGADETGCESPRTLRPPSTLKSRFCEGVADLDDDDEQEECGSKTIPRSASSRAVAVSAESKNVIAKRMMVVRQYKSLDSHSVNPANV